MVASWAVVVVVVGAGVVTAKDSPRRLLRILIALPPPLVPIGAAGAAGDESGYRRFIMSSNESVPPSWCSVSLVEQEVGSLEDMTWPKWVGAEALAS